MILVAITAFLEKLKTGLIDGTIGCTSVCQSIMLGALTRVIGTCGIIESWGGYWFREMSVSRAVQAVKSIKPLDIEWRPKGGGWHKCRSSLSEDVSVFIRSGMDDVEPLELDEFSSTAG